MWRAWERCASWSGSSGEFSVSTSFEGLRSVCIVYVRRATGEKVCTLMFEWPSYASSCASKFQTCSHLLSLSKALNDELYVRHVLTACNCNAMILGHVRQKHVDVLEAFAMET